MSLVCTYDRWHTWYKVYQFAGSDGSWEEVMPDDVDCAADYSFTDIEEAHEFRKEQIEEGFDPNQLKVVEERRRIVNVEEK